MVDPKLLVVLSIDESSGSTPEQIETRVTQLAAEPAFVLARMPDLYDLPEQHPVLALLNAVPCDVIVLSAMYPRAIRCVLERQGVAGNFVEVNRKKTRDAVTDAISSENASRSASAIEKTPRCVYCVSVRSEADWDTGMDCIGEILRERDRPAFDVHALVRQHPNQTRFFEFRPISEDDSSPNDSTDVTDDPTNVTASETPADGSDTLPMEKQRWYPVIDFGRCTHCLECIDFCLFGVYDVDEQDEIVVRQPDACKPGCPACSRVCPHLAILFPKHRSPSIAGADVPGGRRKLDLSDLLGGVAPTELAEHEREMAKQQYEKLLQAEADHDAPAAEANQRESTTPPPPDQRDDLDRLMDQLDASEL